MWVWCKKAFLAIHGLQNNRGRVENIHKKIISGANTPPIDKRGKHFVRPHAYSEDKIKEVKEHIDKIPKYESHYRRSNNNGKLYLGCDTTITACYEHYKDVFCKEMSYDPVSSDKYRRIFTEDYNIGVKSPKTDTCKTCDMFKVKIDGTEDQQVKKRLEHERELHQRKACLLYTSRCV